MKFHIRKPDRVSLGQSRSIILNQNHIYQMYITIKTLNKRVVTILRPVGPEPGVTCYQEPRPCSIWISPWRPWHLHKRQTRSQSYALNNPEYCVSNRAEDSSNCDQQRKETKQTGESTDNIKLRTEGNAKAGLHDCWRVVNDPQGELGQVAMNKLTPGWC